MYEITEEAKEELRKRFTYHPPKGDQEGRYVFLRDAAANFALMLSQNCPPGRELALSLTHLETTVMFANAAIARREWYEITEEAKEELRKRFTYHPPKGDQEGRYVFLRDAAANFALMLSQNCPPGRELALSLTHLETTVMFANAAIARRE